VFRPEAWRLAQLGLPPTQAIQAARAEGRPHRVEDAVVERAKQLLPGGGDLTLAQVAAHAGFADQSQFCQHFKWLIGVAPGQFWMSTRIA
jgi:AraC-like DNA-binding protein